MAVTQRTPAIELTFDDGPDPRWTPLVLDALAEHALCATFFVIAPRATAHPGIVARALAEGHAVQLHCHAHERPDALGPGGVQRDVALALAELATVGLRPTRWRPPWGIVTPPMHRVAGSSDLILTGWTADSGDWRGEPAATGLAAVEHRLRPGAIVLMHDAVGPGAPRAGCAQTVALVGLLAAAMRRRGLRAAIPAAGELRPPAGALPRGGSEPLAMAVSA